MVVGLTLRFFSHFEFIFCEWCYESGPVHSLACRRPAFPAPLVEEIGFSPFPYSRLLLYQRLIDYVIGGLFLGALFCSVDLCVYSGSVLSCLSHSVMFCSLLNISTWGGLRVISRHIEIALSPRPGFPLHCNGTVVYSYHFLIENWKLSSSSPLPVSSSIQSTHQEVPPHPPPPTQPCLPLLRTLPVNRHSPDHHNVSWTVTNIPLVGLHASIIPFSNQFST